MPLGMYRCRCARISVIDAELHSLYERRSRVLAMIRDLESLQLAYAGTNGPAIPAKPLEFSTKPCNLTNCRIA
jgi:hypothetical protein